MNIKKSNVKETCQLISSLGAVNRAAFRISLVRVIISLPLVTRASLGIVSLFSIGVSFESLRVSIKNVIFFTSSRVFMTKKIRNLSLSK